MPTYLDGILSAHRDAAAADRRDLDGLVERARAAPERPRGFAAAIRGAAGCSVIAELKRRTPSKGPLAEAIDPARLAKEYEAGGAACLSVLTDAGFFGALPDDLAAARSATALPTLRKDFTVSAADVADARSMGADAVLLIVAALDDGELRRFLALATELGMDALVEVHDEAELERALGAGAALVGVNRRDLGTFAVERERAAALAGLIPAGVTTVAESGVTGPADVAEIAAAGYDAVLVGEHLMRAADPAVALEELVDAGRRSR